MRRGRGLASALLSHAEAHVLEQGHPAIQLTVGEIAHDNRRLYEHLGYETTNSWESKEFPGLILRRMVKQLVTN